MELQQTLARLRKEHGFSQVELAEELGVTRQAISRWETGAAAPTTENLIALSRLFGVTVDELVMGRREPPEAGGVPEEPPLPAVEDMAEEPPPVIEDAPEESPSAAGDAPSGMKRKNKMVLAIVLVLCLLGGTVLWGKLTNSPASADIYVLWEIFF